MSDAYGMDSAYDPQDDEDTRRRRMLADLLRSSQPQTSGVNGGVAYQKSPMEGVSNLVNRYVQMQLMRPQQPQLGPQGLPTGMNVVNNTPTFFMD